MPRKTYEDTRPPLEKVVHELRSVKRDIDELMHAIKGLNLLDSYQEIISFDTKAAATKDVGNFFNKLRDRINQAEKNFIEHF